VAENGQVPEGSAAYKNSQALAIEMAKLRTRIEDLEAQAQQQARTNVMTQTQIQQVQGLFAQFGVPRGSGATTE